jgi:hypothetical protein
MNAAPSQLRRLAVRLAQHAVWMLPGPPSSWAQAMRREIDYIADDSAALRWALGCLLTSYKARLTHWLRSSPRGVWRHVATSGALMLLIGLALQEHAASQTEPPQPAFDETICDLQAVSPAIRSRLRCDPCGAKIAADFIDHPAAELDTSCSNRTAPIPFLPKHR